MVPASSLHSLLRALRAALLLAAMAGACPARAGQVEALCDRALALKRAGKLEAAAAAFREALARDPESARAHAGLAWVLIARGQRDAAIREFRRVIALAKTGPLADEAAAALERLGAGAEPAQPKEGPSPPPTLPQEPPLEAARRLLAAGEAFRALRALRTIQPDGPAYQQAQSLLTQARQGRRKVPVRAAVDALFRAQPNWERKLRDRFEFASGEIARQVEIDFSLLDLRPWNRRHSTADGLDLIEELQQEIPRGDAEVVLGFVAERREADEAGGRPVAREYTLGLSPCFAGYSMVAEIIASEGGQQLRVPESLLRENLVHELGHLFGAVHVRGESVMRPAPGETPVYDLDALNLQLMRTCRWVDFQHNLLSLSPDELTEMAARYADLEAGAAWDDGVHFYRAAVCTYLQRYREAIDEYQQVLRASYEDAFTHFNLGELYWAVKDTEQARAHWKIAETIGRPAWVRERARQALARER